MPNIDKEHLILVLRQCRPGIEAITKAEEGFVE